MYERSQSEGEGLEDWSDEGRGQREGHGMFKYLVVHSSTDWASGKSAQDRRGCLGLKSRGRHYPARFRVHDRHTVW